MVRVEDGVIKSNDKHKSENKKPPPKIKLGCGGFIIILFLIVLIWLIIIFGLMGIINFPFLSAAEPRRQVDTSGLQSDQLSLDESVAGSTYAGLTEGQLTILLRTALSNLDNQILSESQITIEPNNFELFGKFANRPSVVTTSIIELSVNKEAIDVDIKSFKLGHIALPAFLAQIFIGPVISEILPTILSPAVGKNIIQRPGLIEFQAL
ncbi:hypothetical protein ACFL04_02035 [Patescibacteria group bacterium]